MSFHFTEGDIDSISNVFSCTADKFTRGWTWKLFNGTGKQSLVLTVYNDVNLSSETNGILVSAQTQQGYFELHNCDNYLIFEPDEVLFFASYENKINCMLIGKEGNCSLFSNVSKEVLNSDFSEIDEALLLSAMQLSLMESVLQ